MDVVLKEGGLNEWRLITMTENYHISNSRDSARQIDATYATRLMTEIYHLVQPGRQHTICGLRISRISSERKTNTLQLVNELSDNLAICKHCERIRSQDTQE